MPLTPNVENRNEFYNEILRAREAYQKHIEFLKAKTRSEEGKKELNEAINAILNLKDSNNKVIQLVLAGKTEEAVSIHEQEMLLKLKIMQKELNDFVNFYAKRADELADQSSGYIKREFVILIVSGIIFAIVSFLVSVGVSRSVRISVKGLEKYFQGFTKEILQLILILPLEMK
jgi:methyl-accepting chemotaxis protein